MSELEELLAPIKKRAWHATEGPWAIWHDLDHQGFITVGDKAGVLTEQRPYTEECNPTAHVYADDDAAFIAAARTDVPALLAFIEAGQAHQLRDILLGNKKTSSLECACGQQFDHFGIKAFEDHRTAAQVAAFKEAR